MTGNAGYITVQGYVSMARNAGYIILRDISAVHQLMRLMSSLSEG